jgi:hypothetical protein
MSWVRGSEVVSLGQQLLLLQNAILRMQKMQKHMNKGQQWDKATAETEMVRILVFQLELSSEVPMFLPMILLYRSPGMATMCKLASATLARLCRIFMDSCDKNVAT